MELSSLVTRISGKASDSWKVHYVGQDLAEKEGRDVIFLTVGDPDFDAPRAVIEATCDSLRSGKTHYTPMEGLTEVREALCQQHNRLTGAAVDKDNIVLVSGAQCGLYCTMQCLVTKGDEVIVPEPMYATYEAVLGATGASLVNVPLRSELGFHIDVSDVEKAITSRTKVIWINTPHNPSGAVMTSDEMRAIAQLCVKHHLWLVSDEVYASVCFDREFFSAAMVPEVADRTVIVSSLSKSHAMPGFRLGWVVGPKHLIAAIVKLIQCMMYGGPEFIQDGALVALKQDLPEVQEMYAAYKRRAALICELLKDVPNIRCIPPEGGMFVLIDIRPTGLSGDDFAFKLLMAEGVALLPADAFGPSAHGHQRMTLACSDDRLTEACRRIERFARSLAQHKIKVCE